jgi:hypothetical protein
MNHFAAKESTRFSNRSVKSGGSRMQNKRNFTRFIVIGLLAALTATIYSVAQSTYPSIVGTWETTVPPSAGSSETGYAMLTFFADGNMVEVNAFANPATSAPGRGVWIGAGSKYLLTFVIFTFDDKGKHTGKVKTYNSITMDKPNHFTCTYTADLVDLTGKVTKKVASGTCESTRLEVELP